MTSPSSSSAASKPDATGWDASSAAAGPAGGETGGAVATGRAVGSDVEVGSDRDVGSGDGQLDSDTAHLSFGDPLVPSSTGQAVVGMTVWRLTAPSVRGRDRDLSRPAIRPRTTRRPA